MTPASTTLILLSAVTGALHLMPHQAQGNEDVVLAQTSTAPARAQQLTVIPDLSANCTSLDEQLSVRIAYHSDNRVDYEIIGSGDSAGIFYRMIGHAATRFCVRDGILYRTIYHRHETGARILAHNLNSGEVLWDQELNEAIDAKGSQDIGLSVDQWGPDIVVKVKGLKGDQPWSTVLDAKTGSQVDSTATPLPFN